MKKLLLSYSLMLCLMTAFAQKDRSFWSKTSKEDSFKKELKLRKTNPKKAQYYNLNIDALKNHLTDAPQRKSPVNNSQKLVDFPTANDSFETFSVMEASVLEKPLQDKYPNIKTYVGKSISNPSNTIRFSITPQGLHTMSFKPGSGTEFIDPYTKDSEAYIVYSKKDLPVLDAPWICEFEDDTATNTKQRNVANMSYFNANDGMMRNFRLALACTVEYAQFQWSRAGLTANDTETNKKVAVLAAMVVTINRNNFIYERDLSVTMTIVANNESVIFIDSDNFSNSTATALINESQTVIDANIGSDNYDIGHTFSTGGGGLATMNSPCMAYKARGITGSYNPVGDAYDVDYVAHEIGHQFGAPHTFNGNSGNCAGSTRSASNAYEPGSGSTIMAYAGICAPQNLQSNSDAYFHQKSLQMMWDNIATGNSNCATKTNTGNAAPTSNAGNNFIIPAATPYKLTGTSTDTDGIITHTYTWEQYDLGAAGLPVESNTSGPLVRSYEGTNNTSRYIPRMADILANGGVSTAWEKLASVDRDLNFKLTVRDNDINGGQTATDQMTATVVSAAGPFVVTSQIVNDQVLVAGATEKITWDVAGTTANGINEANVDILLSTDGLNYNTVLAANVPNDGSHDITVPNIPSNSCRIMVAASDNIFFNINAENITITATPAPVIILTGANPQRIELGTAYSELGATATDNIDGDISGSISINATAVNVNIAGDYTVTYNVSDVAGNNAVEVTRTVTITIAGDTFATATTLPFTISAEGTGCATSNIAIDFPNSGFTASGLLGNGTPGNEGVDAFFNWTATTDELRYWGAGAGNPYIGIHDASGTEIAWSNYQDANLVLSGWAVGDELVIRIYDFGEAMVLVDFCLEYYTSPAVPNCAENVSPTGSDVSFNNGVVSLSWDAPSSGPVPTAYEVFWGTTSGFSWGRTSGNLSSSVVIDAPATTANIAGIFYGETYYYSVVPRNGLSLAIGCAEYSLTIENTSVPFNTDFTNYPAGFSESRGPFGTPSTTDNTSRWETSDFLNDATLSKGAKVNIFLLRNEYLISPTFDLSSGTHYLNIDVGITDYNEADADPDGMDAEDDYVAVLLSEDDGATWAELHRWDSTSGLTEVSQAMPEVTLSTVSTTAKIALYAFSGVSGGDYDFHVTNFQVTAAADVTVPVITLIGANPQRIELGTAYSELGATATDNIDGDISASILIDASAVNVNTVGDYTVTYNVSDAAGNAAEEVTRTVTITADVTVPVITLTGADVIQEVGGSYSDAGATASDNIDGTITDNITVAGQTVDPNTVGVYTVTYNVQDAAGNNAVEVKRTVTITADATIPVITLVGANPQSIELGTAYSELGATATDNIDGDITANISIDASAVNVNTVGDYTVTYNVSDANGSAAEEVTRTVIIESSLSTEDNTKNIVKVYPNPVKDKLYIQGLLKPTKISVYNVLGKLVLSKITLSEINVNNLQSGIYIIKVKEEQKEILLKFIKN
jgi:hypothetical protein